MRSSFQRPRFRKRSTMSIKPSMKNERLRSLAQKFRRRKVPKKTSDFGSDVKHETLVLREKIWRFEFSGSKAKHFLKRHKVGAVGVLALIFAGILVRYALVGV